MSRFRNHFVRLEKRIRQIDTRVVLLLLLLTEAVIFFADIYSGPVVSVSPFFCIPIALCAWFLNWPATLFLVVASTVAMVYDFNRLVPVHNPYYIAYDLLQSATFFGVVAVLVAKSRDLMKRFAAHVNLVRSNARHERRRRALEATIRRAVPDDVDTIVRLVSLGAESGAFDEKVSSSAKLIELASNFRNGIADGSAIRDVWNGGQTAVPIEFWVSIINGKVAGFFMMLGLNQNKGAERELHAIAVDHAYRGLGIGSAMVDFFCSHYAQRRLFVLCKPDTVMMGMLKRRNFVVSGKTNMAFEVLVKEA